MQDQANDVAKQLHAMAECAAVIDSIIAAGDHSDDQKEIMRNNVTHIGVACALPHLAGEDLAPYRAAQIRGIVWLDV